MAITSLNSAKLYRTAALKKLTVSSTKHLTPLDEIVGQARARQAVEFAMAIKDKGYNIYALGQNGLGKRTMIMRYLNQHWHPDNTLYDWCYVANFDEARQPKVLKLPAGKGQGFKKDIEKLMGDLCKTLAMAFNSDMYHSRSDMVETEFKDLQKTALEELGVDAETHNLSLSITPDGNYQFVAMNGDEPHTEESYDELSDKEQAEFDRVIKKLEKRLRIFSKEVGEWEKTYIENQQNIDHEVTRKVLNDAFKPLKKGYHGIPEALQHLEAMQEDIIENIDLFLEEDADQLALTFASLEKKLPRRYQINLIVNHQEHKHPVIVEDVPNYHNIFGQVENTTFKGTVFTDFSMIRSGSIHRANGGVLLIDAIKLIEQPYVWDGIKRALSRQSINVSSLEREVSINGSISLEPESIPLDVKIILFGDYHTYTLLQKFDAEFSELFKITADFEDVMKRDHDSELKYAELISSICHDNQLLHCDKGAMARIIEHGSREAGDQNKLSLHASDIANLLREANFQARNTQSKLIRASHVEKALASRDLRVSRIRDEIMDGFINGTTLLDVSGKKVGVINALSVLATQDFSFGVPNRITATTAHGDGGVFDIERDAELGGNIHSKGVMILTAYLASLFGQTSKIPFTTHLAFEQSYNGVDGDSASMAEFCAIISSMSGIPLRQDLAITGSMNQFGEAQPIGGVNEKIEGFFDVCTIKGPNNKQGVIIPRSNIHHLMLRKDIIHAVEKNQFHIYAIDHVSEAIQILTDIKTQHKLTSDHIANHPIYGKINKKIIENTQS